MQVIGNFIATAQPELAYSTAGNPWTRIRLAETFINPDGERRQKNFIDGVAFGRTAEQLAEVAEGDTIFIAGELEMEKNEFYVSKNSTHPWLPRIVVRRFEPVA